MIVKICGMRRQEDIDLATSCGVDWCGFIFHKKSPRYIAPHVAGELNSHHLKRVGVFVNQDVEELLRIMDLARLDMAQLHGQQTIDVAKAIGTERVIRVLWPEQYQNKQEMETAIAHYQESCAYFLVDSGSSGGGSGKQLSGDILEEIHFGKPWLLAGGLNVSNVEQALQTYKPLGVDINSGIEDTAACKNAQSMQQIMNIIRECF